MEHISINGIVEVKESSLRRAIIGVVEESVELVRRQLRAARRAGDERSAPKEEHPRTSGYPTSAPSYSSDTPKHIRWVSLTFLHLQD